MISRTYSQSLSGDVFQGQNQGSGFGLAAGSTNLSLPVLAINGTPTDGVFGGAGQTACAAK